MKYFHLTPDKQTRGPYSAAEMRALRASGAIDDDTLAAAAGDSNWRPYRELEFDTSLVPPPIGPRTLGNCPFCGQEIVGTETPAECPHCAKTLHPGTGNLWLNFLSCMRRYVCFRGRATRTEFWSFYLFYLVIGYVAKFVIELTMTLYFDYPVDLQDQLRGAEDIPDMIALLQPHLGTIIGGTLAEYGVGLLFLLPYLAVTVRRLHDTGRSAAALLWYALGLLLCFGGGGWYGWTLWSVGADADLLAEALGSNHAAVMNAAVALVSGFLILCVSGIYLFVCFLLPTKKGGNKYGPGL